MAIGYYLRKLPDPILRQQAVEVEDFPNLDELLSNLYEILSVKRGVGLAAPQIGDSRRVAIIKINGEIREFINPRKLKEGINPYSIEEGCLSIPDTFVSTHRNYPIQIEYQDRRGVHHTERFTGFNAVVLQHEMDHLDGKLIIDYSRF